MLVVFTDLDGTLLDRHSYSFEEARPALDALARRRIPLILCTSKTRAEVEVIRARLGNRHPFIVENGGAVFVPSGYFPFSLPGGVQRDSYEVLQLGDGHKELAEILREASRQAHCQVLAFHQMSDAEVSACCNLPLPDAALARKREFGEAFLILTVTRAPALMNEIERRGKRWTRGDRCYHITGGNDKAAAVRVLAGLYRRAHGPITTAGLGDAPNDAEFLDAVDLPVIVRSPFIQELRDRVPRATPTLLDGPAGWNRAILEMIPQ